MLLGYTVFVVFTDVWITVLALRQRACTVATALQKKTNNPYKIQKYFVELRERAK